MNEHPLQQTGIPVMRQVWGGLLFLHWPVPLETLRSRIPEQLEVETFGGTAWIGVTPFSMWGIALPFFPAIPLASRSLEINVRTYVRHGDASGVWFFSLDAANPLVVYGARAGYGLPYYHARMHREEAGGTVRYRSCRIGRGAPPAEFEAEWRPKETMPPTRPGTLEFFLTERYVLFSRWRGKLLRAHIRHRPWPLGNARIVNLFSTMVQALGIEIPDSDPHLLVQSEPLHVKIGSPKEAE